MEHDKSQEDSILMNFLKIINKDKEICELKSFIEKETGHVPGFRFWDGELTFTRGGKWSMIKL